MSASNAAYKKRLRIAHNVFVHIYLSNLSASYLHNKYYIVQSYIGLEAIL